MAKSHQSANYLDHLIDVYNYENANRTRVHKMKTINGTPISLTRSNTFIGQIALSTSSSSEASTSSSTIPLKKKQYTVVYTIKRGYFNLVRHLLDLGLDPNHVSSADDNGMRTPLILCTFIRDERWSFNIAQNLLEHGASLRKCDNQQLTPIHYCCAFGRDKLLELFLNSLDYDLSKSIDLNGNSCMHYAIRSHSLKCVELLVNKFKSIYGTYSPSYPHINSDKRLNFKNKFGLRPTDIDEELEHVNSNRVYPGRNSIVDCRSCFIDFLKTDYIMRWRREAAENLLREAREKQMQQYQQQQQQALAVAEEPSHRGAKTAPNKTTNKHKKSSKSSERDDEFFKTQQQFVSTFEVSHEIIKISEINNSKSATVGKESLKNMSHFNHFIPPPKLTSSQADLKSILSLEQKINSSRLTETYDPKNSDPNETDKIKLDAIFKSTMDKITTIELIARSFLISLNTLLRNYIEFNPLFFDKEYLAQSALNNIASREEAKSSKATSALKRSKTSQDLTKKPIMLGSYKFEHEGRKGLVHKFDWRDELPTMYGKLENFMSSNYREGTNLSLIKAHPLSSKNLNEFRAQLKQSADLHRKKNKNHVNSVNNQANNNPNRLSVPNQGRKKSVKKYDPDNESYSDEFSSNSYYELNNSSVNGGMARRKSVVHN